MITPALKIFATTILILAFGILPNPLLAQENELDGIKLTPSISYVSENWRGNIGFAIGLKITKPVSKRLSLENGLSYFSTGLVNINQNSNTFDGEDRHYNSLILTPNLSYRLAGSTWSKYSAIVRIGPSFKYYRYKDFSSGLLRINPDGTAVAAPGAVINYNEENGFNISLFGALGIDRKISEKLRAGIFIDTYSSRTTPLEYLMPGFCLSFSL